MVGRRSWKNHGGAFALARRRPNAGLHTAFALFLAACSRSTPAPATPTPTPVSEPATATSQGAVASPPGERARTPLLPRDARPTIAVLYFDNGAIGRAAEFEPLRKAMADVLITELSQNPNLRVVERDRLQALLEEQDLSGSKHIDKETAVRVGKLVGAHHMIFGDFVVDLRGAMRIDARAVDVETSEIEHTETVTDQADNLLKLLPALADKLNSGLKLPPMPDRRVRDLNQTAPRSGDLRYLITYARAMDAQDNREKDRAVALYREFLQSSPPTLLVAQRRLAEDRIRRLQSTPHLHEDAERP
jgi:TolB-like protein